MPLPLLWIVGGGAAAVGALSVFNTVDDNIIDPLTGETDRPIISDRLAVAVTLAGAIYLAKREGWIS